MLLAELQLAQGHAEQAGATAQRVPISTITSSRIARRLEQVTAAASQHAGGHL
ncbi:hypothetical protein ABZU86_13650 [Streptomyces sp. NPDC005271]|uniref:hypothetical protein n=1 Tax=unclassified Streptomyces TaxID=2593676 RepID=UPI0033A88813